MEESMWEIGFIHKKGWLTKSPPVTQFNRNKSWKKRYFVLLQVNPDSKCAFLSASKKTSIEVTDLEDFYLVYWESDTERRKSNSKPIRAIQLLHQCHVHKYSLYEQKYHNVIVLNTDNRVYFFSADNEEEMNSWYTHLNNAVNWVKDEDVEEPKQTSAMITDDDEPQIEVLNEHYDHLDRHTRAQPLAIPERKDSYRNVYDTSSVFTPTNNKFLTRSSFGSIYGYSSHDVTNSPSTPMIEAATNGNECFYQQMDGVLKESADSLLPVPQRRHYSESSLATEKKEASCSNPFRFKPRSNSTSSALKRPFDPLPPMPSIQERRERERVPLPTPPAIQEMTLNEVDESARVGERIYDDIDRTYFKKKRPPEGEFYTFSKGPDGATLKLFDTTVKLPDDTVTSITSDGLMMRYGGHEILIRKSRRSSRTDVIDV